MWGSRPLADAVTRSTGTGPSFPGSAAFSAATRAATAWDSAGLVGPRFDPDEAVALYGAGEVADGRGQKYFGSVNGWPIRREPIGLPSRTIRLPPACRGKATRATAVTTPG